MSRSSLWFKIPVVGSYFRWLEGDAPNGLVERYPILGDHGESSVPGIYIAGDLTGVPLLKFAAEGGADLIRELDRDASFQTERKNRDDETYDVVIIGAGLAGCSAAIEAQALGLRFVVLEADRAFSTIHNFPAGKPIYTYPEELEQKAQLKTVGSTKENLLEHLEGQLEGLDLPIETAYVKGISGRKGAFSVEVENKSYKALRVLVAIGKSGNARKLDVKGEDLPKVYNRLIDPKDFAGQRVLVVGGGDSAVEAALLLAEQPDTSVTLSYRGAELSRPKPDNVAAIKQAASSGKVDLLLGSKVQEVQEKQVQLQSGDKSQTLENDAVLVQIGKELPIAFFSRSKIDIENTWTLERWVMLWALLFFSGIVYFGKKADVFAKGSLWDSLTGAPAYFTKMLGTLGPYQWPKASLSLLAWASLLGFAVTGIWSLVIFGRKLSQYFATRWKMAKSLYFLGVGLFFVGVYLSEYYLKQKFLGKSMGFWYTFWYSVTITTFGIRRILARRSRYITLQTTSLILIQVFPLFLLPEFILPWMDQAGWMPAAVKSELFPGGSYWRAYGFILAWPLMPWGITITGTFTTTWLVIMFLQSFVIIPLLVWKWGKGAYCGWICSCGALAETLGDEYRTTAWHGPLSRSFEHVGQVVLFVAIGLTGWHFAAPYIGTHALLTHLQGGYMLIVDVLFAGVLGVGVYFFLSGRFWCRFLCPLSALMHIYTRFSRYRIFSDKKKCISCGECTRACHMGIDVMNYANKGVPMDNYECVRCSACVYVCPVQCLNFGEMKGGQSVASLLGLREEKAENLISSETIQKQLG
ncbi:MAG: NAD(P)-binding domain-containing protein [Myxococcales bacterium]|nr:NAD(P)-binding domain-containing protein [Myxococcales bacterium]